MATKPVEVQGGAKVEERVVKPIAPEVEAADDVIGIVSTALGTFGPGGIAPVGTKARVKLDAYSSAWMQPATKADAEKLAAFIEAKKKGA